MYEGEGRVPSKKNSKRIFKRGKRTIVLPSKIHEKWHKDAMIYLKAFGVPNTPIMRVMKCKCVIYYPDHRVADNTNKVESIHDLMVDAKVLHDDSWQVMPKTSQEALYRKNKGGFKLYLTIDETHPDNKRLAVKTLPVVEVIS